MSQNELVVDCSPPEDCFSDAQPSLVVEQEPPETADPPQPMPRPQRPPVRCREFSSGFHARLGRLTASPKFLLYFGTKRNCAVVRIDYSALGYDEIMEFQSGCSELALTDKTVKSLRYEENAAVFEAGFNKRWDC